MKKHDAKRQECIYKPFYHTKNRVCRYCVGGDIFRIKPQLSATLPKFYTESILYGIVYTVYYTLQYNIGLTYYRRYSIYGFYEYLEKEQT